MFPKMIILNQTTLSLSTLLTLTTHQYYLIMPSKAYHNIARYLDLMKLYIGKVKPNLKSEDFQALQSFVNAVEGFQNSIVEDENNYRFDYLALIMTTEEIKPFVEEINDMIVHYQKAINNNPRLHA